MVHGFYIVYRYFRLVFSGSLLMAHKTGKNTYNTINYNYLNYSFYKL
jgi:hypothetical protein